MQAIERRRASVLIPSARVRRLVRLVGEVRELARTSADPLSHLLEGMVQLVGGEMGAFGRMPRDMVPGSNATQMVFAGGWSDEVRRGFARLYQRDHGSAVNPFVSSMIAQTPPGAITVGRRCDFMQDREWYRSAFFNEFGRPWRVGDSVSGFVRLADGRSMAFTNLRGLRARHYSEVDRALVELLVEQCVAQLFAPRPVRPLSPRQLQVRGRLLDGAAPTQIAAELGLSVNTINEYIRGVYRAEGVTTRAELQARALYASRRY
jgi:DNA-binding CsgD family transcriptional regulator